MFQGQIIYRVHAIRRMFQRRISEEDVRSVLNTGGVIDEYPDDTPYPSRLVLGWCGNRPIHIVSAYNSEAEETIIITVYEPDADKWDAEFKRKRK
jgi:hypothetical protein